MQAGRQDDYAKLSWAKTKLRRTNKNEIKFITKTA